MKKFPKYLKCPALSLFNLDGPVEGAVASVGIPECAQPSVFFQQLFEFGHLNDFKKCGKIYYTKKRLKSRTGATNSFIV